MADTPNYDVNYDDKRFKQVESDKTAAINEMENTYNGMINSSDSYFQGQIDAVNNWGETQKKNQQAQTDFAIEKIEQQKQQTEQDYHKEQSAAYADWQKQSNKYGANAEQMAAQGMQNTGFSESSQVAMYNQYQNRVAVARQTVERAKLNYDNQMNEARLQNNAILAEIAYNTLQQSLELGLQGFQYKNTLLLDKVSKKQELDNQYYQRYQNVLNQINTENAMKENVRQYNESLAENKRQHDENLKENRRQHDENLEENRRQYDKSFAENVRQYNTTHNTQKEQWSRDHDLKKRAQNLAEKQYEDQKKNNIIKVDDNNGGKVKGAKPSGKDSSSIRGSKTTHGGGGGKFGESTSKTSGKAYLSKLIKSGANEDKVANEISMALRSGAISRKEAADLRKAFTPRGVRYN